jgi:hypothetical protein
MAHPAHRPAHVADISDTATPLTDSLLHTDIRRVLLGAVCGVGSGLVLLAITMILAPAGEPKNWWLHLMASPFYGGNALAYDAPGSVITAGIIFHFAISILLGLGVGKMTQTKSIGRMLFYGFVLGFLCWLASNMFGPDILDVEGLSALSEFHRVLMFWGFSLSLALFIGLGAQFL